MTVAPVRPGSELDWEALEAHLRSALTLPGDPLLVQQFTAGRANLTYLLQFGHHRLVLRRPPNGMIAPGAHDMHREYRVLSRLSAIYERAPLALLYSEDTSIIGAPFVVMQYREGEVLIDSIPSSMAHHLDVVRRVDLALIDAVADLHMVDPTRHGLLNLGRPEAFGDRQVAGWANRWHRAASDGKLPVMQEIANRLAGSVPSAPVVAVIHNDLKLDNCQFNPNDPDRVTSVFDWDMATLGDPLFDLGALLVSMGSQALWSLSTEEALTRYTDRSGIDVTQIDWYLAFATWRTAIVLKQIHNRYLLNESNDERVAQFGSYVPALAERATALLDRSHTPPSHAG